MKTATKTIVLCGMALLTVGPAFGQTRPQGTSTTNSPVTMIGCVGGSTDAAGFTLGNAMVVPGTAQPGQLDRTPSPMPPPMTTAAQPTGITPARPATPTSPVSPATPPAAGVPPAASPAQTPVTATAAAVPPAASPAQTPVVPPAAAAAGAVGTAGTTPTSVTGTSGSVTGGATAGTPGSTGGYRLSGTDMRAWAGQRVMVVGTFAPAPATAAGATATGQPGSPAAPPLEFRVQSVQPTSGPCPK